MRIARCLMLVGALSAALGLAGCPVQPTLSVSPSALLVDADASMTTFRITNVGGGTLTWEARESEPWLSLSLKSTDKQASQSLSGSTTSEVEFIDVTVDRTGLPEGPVSGVIEVTSNGGARSIPISVDQANPGVLLVSRTEIDFGANSSQNTFNVSNGGQDRLEWSLAVTPAAPWLTVAPTSGILEGATTQTEVNVEVDRGELTGGTQTATITVSSPTGGSHTIDVSVFQPPFSVSRTTVDFGSIASPTDSETLTITNNTGAIQQLNATVVTASGGDWLTLDPASLSIGANSTSTVGLIVNTTGLAPASYTATATLTAGAFSQEIAVTMAVIGFSTSTSLLEFGTINTPATQTFELVNRGTADVAYTLSIPAGDTWLTVNPQSGSVDGTQVISVTADPTGLDPANYQSTITVTFPGGTSTVTVRLTRPRPAALTVVPTDINFGATNLEQDVTIYNDGIGTIDWSLDPSGFPAWLTLVGATSGTVSGSSDTDSVQLRVNRSAAPAGQFSLLHVFEVGATGDSNTPVTVTVRATVPRVPIIEVEAEGVDENDVDFINFSGIETAGTFLIRNTGNNDLNWSIDATTLPEWIVSITPLQGTVEANAEQTVTITISRETLDFTGAQMTLLIESNDPEDDPLPLLVEVQVSKQVLIGARPASIAFGVNDNSGTLEVANFGDPDTVLNFQVTSSKEWLTVFPETGRSVGTIAEFKDFQPIGVSVDRSLLDSAGASASLIISAFEIQDGVRVPVPGVQDLDISVTVEAAELTIESAGPRTRIPSLVRTVLMMRNIRFQTVPIPDSRMDEIGDQFRIFEESEPLELTESNQFLSSGARLRTNALVLLDYSGSMQAAAQKLVADGQLGDPENPPADALQAMYEQTLLPLIEELPSNIRLGFAIFNDRAPDAEGSVRIIRPDVLDPIFVQDKDELAARLQSIDVEDNGATELLPAIERASEILFREDPAGLFAFDDADVKALICVSDGRLTTPPGSITDTRDLMRALGVRLFSVGWGENVARDPLIRLSTGTGGHFYSTRNAPTGVSDPFGNPIRKPLLSELANWFETSQDDRCDQSILKDLGSQVVLSYATLREQGNVLIEGRVNFNDPNDGPQDPLDPTSACLPDQGEITGNFTFSQVNLLNNVGDIRLGQISLRASRINQAAGTATVFVRADYIPRNISTLTFQFDVFPEGIGVEILQVPFVNGGIIQNWTRSTAGDLDTFTSPGGPLQYGEFGDMLELRFTNVTGPFFLDFEVVSPSFIPGNLNVKYFTHPDAVFVNNDYIEGNRSFDEFKAVAFPRPLIGSPFTPSDYDPLTYDFGVDEDSATFELFNVGGSHIILDEDGGLDEDLSVGLGWSAEEGNETDVLVIEPNEGFITSVHTSNSFTITVDRDLPPGDYEAEVFLSYDFGSLNLNPVPEPFLIKYEISEPLFAVAPQQLAFGSTQVELPLTVQNNGQSSFEWEIDEELLPPWLTVSVSAGEVGAGQQENSRVQVNRTGLLPGDYQHNLQVQAPDLGEVESVLVTMTVP